MAGGRNGFLDELTGDFVVFLRGDSAVSEAIGSATSAKIFAEAARQGVAAPFIVYTQSGGSESKILGGLEGCLDITLHVYCYADTQQGSRSLAHAVSNRMLPHQGVVGDGSVMHVCNGGIIDSGVDHDKASGDRKRYWTRIVLRMVVE